MEINSLNDLIKYTNSEGESVYFTYKEPFYLNDKEGFETVENEIISDVQSDVDGEVLLGTRLQKRDLLIDVTVIGETTDDRYNLRRNLLQVLNPKIAGFLTYFVPNGKQYTIDVIPQKPTFKSFQKGDSILTNYDELSIHFVALDPYWRDVSTYNSFISLSQINNMFSFPLEITNDFVFSTIKSGDIKEIENMGDVEVGGIFQLKMYTPCLNPRIYNILTQEFFQFDGEYSVGTILTINTQKNQKKVTKMVDGITINAMSERNPESKFLLIRKKKNYFQIQADSGIEGCIGTLEFRPLVIGV